jgi:hypothetical protein
MVNIDLLRSCTSLKILVINVDPGYPQGAPLQVNCVGVPLVGTLRSMLLLKSTQSTIFVDWDKIWILLDRCNYSLSINKDRVLNFPPFRWIVFKAGSKSPS